MVTLLAFGVQLSQIQVLLNWGREVRKINDMLIDQGGERRLLSIVIKECFKQ